MVFGRPVMGLDSEGVWMSMPSPSVFEALDPVPAAIHLVDVCHVPDCLVHIGVDAVVEIRAIESGL